MLVTILLSSNLFSGNFLQCALHILFYHLCPRLFLPSCDNYCTEPERSLTFQEVEYLPDGRPNVTYHLPYTFKSVGRFRVRVLVSNAVSEVDATIVAVVQEAITGIKVSETKRSELISNDSNF